MSGFMNFVNRPSFASLKDKLLGDEVDDRLFLRAQSGRFVGIDYYPLLLRPRDRLQVKYRRILALVQVVPDLTRYHAVIPGLVISLCDPAP